MNKIFKKAKHAFENDKQFIFKILLTATTRGLAALGTFVFNFALARVLGIESYGTFMLLYSIMIGLSFIARCGAGSAILRFASVFIKNKELGKLIKLRRDVSLLIIANSIVLGSIYLLSYEKVIDWFFEGRNVLLPMLIITLTIPFYSNLTIQSSYIKAFKKPHIAPFFEVGLTVFITGIVVLGFNFILETVSLNKVSYIFLLSNILIVALGYFYLNKLILNAKAGTIFKRESYEGFYQTLPNYALSAITSYFLIFSPTLIIGILKNPEQVGLFSIANSISILISFILWIVNTVYAPYYASLYQEGNKKKILELLRNSTRYLLLIATPLFILILLFSKQLLGIFGDEFVQARFALIILAVGQYFSVVTGPVYFLLNMTGHEKVLKNIVIFTAITTIILTLILTNYYGFIGAAISTAFGLVLQNSFSYYHCKKNTGIDYLRNRIDESYN